VSIRVRAKSSDGEVRFFGDDAEPLDKAIENISASIRVYLSPASTDMEALKKRLQPFGAGGASGPSGEVVLVAGLNAGREIEVKLPGRFMLDAAVRGAIKTAPGVTYLEEV
jgi:DNA polymerase-3 subunit alpha